MPQKPVTFTEVDCPVKVPEGAVTVTCGWLRVPENRSVANSPTIQLMVAWLHSTAAHPGAPVVDLGGGPGFPAVENLASLVKSPILKAHDLIVWDQRGIGFSKPTLDCPEYSEAVFEMLNTTAPPSTEGKEVDAAVRACHERLVGDGIDLNGFNTLENVADLIDLRKALKIPEWNLHAASYGTVIAQQLLRGKPEGVRSVLLDSVVPPDDPVGALQRAQSAQRAMNALYDACAAEPTCKQKYGDLRALVAKAATALNEHPYHTVVTDASDGTKHDMTVTGDDLYAGLFQALYQPTLIKAIPAAMQQIANGQNDIIATLASSAVPLATGSSTGMMLSVNCADRQRLYDKAALDRFIAANREFATIVYLTAPENECPDWHVASAPESFNALVTSTDVPVLVVAGTFDPITPPAGSKRVADAMGAKFLEFPDAGHGAVGPSQCSIDIWFAFMANPKADLDTSCMPDLKAPTMG